MIKVFCEGNSWKQNVEEIIEKMMGFLEVLLQLMITSQCFFFLKNVSNTISILTYKYY